MANPVKPVDVSDKGDGSVVMWKWTLTSADATGAAVQMPEWVDRSVHFVSSSWGSATAAMEGSNEGTDFQPIKSPSNAAITATANSLNQLLESTLYVRPRLSAVGTGASVDCYLLVRRAQPLRV